MHSLALTGRFGYIHTDGWQGKNVHGVSVRCCANRAAPTLLKKSLLLMFWWCWRERCPTRLFKFFFRYSAWDLAAVKANTYESRPYSQTIQWVLVSCDLHLKRNVSFQNNFVLSCRHFTPKRWSVYSSIIEPPLVLFSTRVYQLFPLHQSLLHTHTQNVSTLRFCLICHYSKF